MKALNKLSSFHIQHFRSILDSGWRSLSNDNITILIGQNESGKTSVLEALYCFYKGKIHEDMLRSDNSLPSISCEFSLERDKSVYDLLDKNRIPKELIDICKEKTTFRLERKWLLDKSVALSVIDDELFKFFDENNKRAVEIKRKTLAVATELINRHDDIKRQLNALKLHINLINKEEIDTKKSFEHKKKQHRRTRNTEDKALIQNNLGEIEKQAQEIYDKKNELERQVGELNAEAKSLSKELTVGEAMLLSIKKQDELEIQIETAVQNLSELDYLYSLTSDETNRKDISGKRQVELNLLDSLKTDLQTNDREVKLNTSVAYKVLVESKNIVDAEKEAKQDMKAAKSCYNQYTLAQDLFGEIPVFEFFEDFSGLLPNKIDLEDLLSNNEQVEGYKAAQNYLNLAGLDSTFFREKNQRILKQKIETLNTGLTVNFQDYWTQKVGKDDQIKLNFELEHYDYMLPEKSGMPYIEFWIKDKQERLYPKQRSRGVRWFLSFYLELKSAAGGSKSRNRVLLIDEPGLSLHARAQEDVLKVFEDLKDNMQIIYSTHSPNLVKTEKLYRVLAIQRAAESDDNSETLIYDPAMLSEASADTLTPVYSLMGVRLSDQQFVHRNNNIIIPDIVTYYYLHWLSKLFPEFSDIHFIPATGQQTIPIMVNILAGWQLNFGAVLFGSQNNDIYKEILDSTLLNGDRTFNRVKLFEKYQFIEDVFSVLDFKNHILGKRVGITEQNSEYIMVNSLSRRILATNFVNNFNEGRITLDSLDDISQTNIREMFIEMHNLLKQ